VNAPLYPVKEISELVRAVNAANRAMREFHAAAGKTDAPRNYFTIVEGAAEPVIQSKRFGAVVTPRRREA